MSNIVCSKRKIICEGPIELACCSIIDDFFYEGKGGNHGIPEATCLRCQKNGAPSLDNFEIKISLDGLLCGKFNVGHIALDGYQKAFGFKNVYEHFGYTFEKVIKKLSAIAISKDEIRKRLYWAYRHSLIESGELEAITQKYGLDSELTEVEINELELFSAKDAI